MARLADLTITVPANDILHQPVRGSYLFIKSAGAPFELRIDNGETISADTNTELEERQEWSVLTFKNNTGSDIDIEFYYGDGTVKTNGITFSGSLALTKATTLSQGADKSVADSNLTQLVPSATSTREAILKNMSSDKTIRINGGSASLIGHPLGPQETIVLTTNDGIWGYHEEGSNVDVSVLLVQD